MGYIAVANGKNKGVYKFDNKESKKALLKKCMQSGISVKCFDSEKEKSNALSWAGVKDIANAKQIVAPSNPAPTKEKTKTAEQPKAAQPQSNPSNAFNPLAIINEVLTIAEQEFSCLYRRRDELRK